MQPLRNALLWSFFWPVKLPIWLWQQETIGKVFAALWIACLLVIGLNLLPRQGEKFESSPITTTLAATQQPSLLTILRNAATPLAEQRVGQDTTGLTLSKAVLIVAPEVSPIPTLTATMTTVDFVSATLATATPTDSSVLHETLPSGPTLTSLPTLTATVTPLPPPTVTRQPTQSPTSLPTVTPFSTPTSELVAAIPTVVIPASTATASPIEPTATVTDLNSGNPNGFTCVGGCSEAPDPSCAIKGNVNAKGDKIYHIPGGKNYNLTRIKPAEGDRWFCTEQEAQDAGFRAAKSY
ncbi:hypothetical protein BH10CHL1_BH10CHL1_20730 [soil metagenome]